MPRSPGEIHQLCQALAEKISQTTGHLGEAKAFCAKAGENGRWPNPWDFERFLVELFHGCIS